MLFAYSPHFNAQYPPSLLTQFRCIRYWRFPSLMLAYEPFGRL
jgi:hypothetical protein